MSEEIGNSLQNNCNIHLRINKKVVTDSQMISERFNSFFIDTVEDLLGKNNSYTIKQTSKHDIKTCPKSMFATPVTETEVENV